MKEAIIKRDENENKISEAERYVEKLLKEHDEMKQDLSNVRLSLMDSMSGTKTLQKEQDESTEELVSLGSQLEELQKINEQLNSEMASYQKNLKTETKRTAENKAKIQALEELNE